MKPIVITGGGLAGLSLGIGLRQRSVPVTIHEAGRYPRHRVCGEFISGVSDDTLRRLGVDFALRDANELRSVAWACLDREVLRADLPEPASAISRFRLDARLADAFAEAGGTLHQSSRQGRDSCAGHVWAAGRAADRSSDWLGLKLHASGLSLDADLEMHLGTDGYVGIAPVEDGRQNICGLFRRRALRGKGAQLLINYLEDNALGELARRLKGAEVDAESFVGVSAFRLGRQQGNTTPGVLGDADRMIPPFTGNGMSMAFEAAEVALAPLTTYSHGECSWQHAVEQIRGRSRKRFTRRLRAAGALHPLLLSKAGRGLLSWSARWGVFPFAPLYRLCR